MWKSFKFNTDDPLMLMKYVETCAETLGDSIKSKQRKSMLFNKKQDVFPKFSIIGAEQTTMKKQIELGSFFANGFDFQNLKHCMHVCIGCGKSFDPENAQFASTPMPWCHRKGFVTCRICKKQEQKNCQTPSIFQTL